MKLYAICTIRVFFWKPSFLSRENDEPCSQEDEDGGGGHQQPPGTTQQRLRRRRRGDGDCHDAYRTGFPFTDARLLENSKSTFSENLPSVYNHLATRNSFQIRETLFGKPCIYN